MACKVGTIQKGSSTFEPCFKFSLSADWSRIPKARRKHIIITIKETFCLVYLILVLQLRICKTLERLARQYLREKSNWDCNSTAEKAFSNCFLLIKGLYYCFKRKDQNINFFFVLTVVFVWKEITFYTVAKLI